MKTGEFVYPGAELSFSEEFIPGDGTYEENGRIYASITGILNVDVKEKKITVVPKTNTIPILKNGDIVIARVADIKPQIVIVDIVRLKDSERALPGAISGGIHISEVKDSYVRELYGEFKVGDIIYAKVTNAARISVQLSTSDKNLGVVKAFCSSCNSPLVKVDSKLKCRCGGFESRKLSSEYGKGLI